MSLSSLIVQREVASIRQVEEALARQVLYGGDLVTNLMEVVQLPEAILVPLLAESEGMVAAPIGMLPAPSPQARALVPEDVAARRIVMPLAVDGDRLILAVSEPLGHEDLEELSFALGVRIEERIAPTVRIREALARVYGLPLERRMARLVGRLAGVDPTGPNSLPPVAGPKVGIPSLPTALVHSIPKLNPPGMPVLGTLRFPESRTAQEPPRTEAIAPPAPPAPPPRTTSSADLKAVLPSLLREVKGSPEGARRRGPITLEHVNEELSEITDREGLLKLFFDFSRQFFEYSAIFVAHGDLAEGRDAFGSGAPRDKVLALGVPLDIPSILRTARERGVPVCAVAEPGGLDGVLMGDLGRDVRSKILVVPLVVRSRVVAFFIADDGAVGIDPGSQGQVATVAGLVGREFERLIVRIKLHGFSGEAPAKERKVDARRVVAKPRRRTAESREAGVQALEQVFTSVTLSPAATNVEPQPAEEAPAPVVPPPLPPAQPSVPPPASLRASVRAPMSSSAPAPGSLRASVRSPDFVAPIANPAPANPAPANPPPGPKPASAAPPAAEFFSPPVLRASSFPPPPRAPATLPPPAPFPPPPAPFPLAPPSVPMSALPSSPAPPLGPADDPSPPPGQSYQTLRNFPAPTPTEIDEATEKLPPVALAASAEWAADREPVLTLEGEVDSDFAPISERAYALGGDLTPPPPTVLAVHRPSGRPIPREEEDSESGPVSSTRFEHISSRPPPPDLRQARLLREIDALTAQFVRSPPVKAQPVPSRGVTVAPHRPPTSRAFSDPLPSVIVEVVDAQKTEKLVEAFVADPTDEHTEAELLRLGQQAMPSIMKQFPGAITISRAALDDSWPRVTECGPILRLVARQRRVALPFVLNRTESTDTETRFWATFLLTELLYAEAVPAVVARLFDDSKRIRRAARLVAHVLFDIAPAALVTELDRIVHDARASVARKVVALDALGELRDAKVVPILIGALADEDEDIGLAARKSLLLVSRQDFGRETKKWVTWWQTNASRHRIEWLIDALTHDVPAHRRAAGQELKIVTEQYFGYYDDLPKKDREKAQQKYREWWLSEGQARFRKE